MTRSLVFAGAAILGVALLSAGERGTSKSDQMKAPYVLIQYLGYSDKPLWPLCFSESSDATTKLAAIRNGARNAQMEMGFDVSLKKQDFYNISRIAEQWRDSSRKNHELEVHISVGGKTKVIKPSAEKVNSLVKDVYRRIPASNDAYSFLVGYSKRLDALEKGETP